MKNSQQILGLPVLSIEEGKQIGTVKYLVLDPKQGKVSYILVADDAWYLGLKNIPFEAVQGIGEFGLTIANRSSLTAIKDNPEAIALLETDLRLSGTRVLSRKGRLQGTVSEYIVNENNGGIAGCQLTPVDSDEPAGIIPRKCILTFGLDFLVVEEAIENMLVADPEDLEDYAAAAAPVPGNGDQSKASDVPATKTEAVSTPAAAAPIRDAGAAEKEEKPADALKHFEEQQRKYLLGKKVTMKIVADNGEVIAEEGATVTHDMIERARIADKYIQLTLNIRE